MTIHPKRNNTTTFGPTSFRKYKKRKDKNIQYRTGKKFPVEKAHRIELQHLLHQHQVNDYNKNRCDCHNGTIEKSYNIGGDRILMINPV